MKVRIAFQRTNLKTRNRMENKEFKGNLVFRSISF